MTLDEARTGFEAGQERVVYTPRPGINEDGTIVRVGEYHVFVRYDGDTTPKATNPVDLIWP